MAWRSALDLLERQAAIQATLSALLVGVSDEVALHPPQPGSRSIAEVVAHMVLTERRIASDIELMARYEHPDLPSITLLDEPAVLREIVAEVGGVAGLVEAFQSACQQTLALVRGLSEAEEARTGRGPELGNVLVGCHATNNARYHYPGHLAELRQIRRLLGLPESEPTDQTRLQSNFLA